MAKDMDDGEFWLPSDFLSDDLGFGSGSPLDSPPETESDENENDDDVIAGLTRNLAFSSLHDDDLKLSAMAMATSPQSTLCGIGSWSFSSNESSDGPSKLPSPSKLFQQPRDFDGDDDLDLLYGGAAGYRHGFHRLPHKPLPQFQQTMGHSFSNRALIQHQLRAARFHQLKRQQLMKEQQYTASLARRQSREHGSGMTAVFLNGAKRQSTGTGVFLPRGAGTLNETPQKQACCPTVLLPARVVQALSLLENDGVMMGRTHDVIPFPKGNQRPGSGTGREIRLPREWTY